MRKTEIDSLMMPETAIIRDALQCFDRSGIQAVLLCDKEGRLAGLVTEGDVRRALLSGHGLLSPLKAHANINPVVGTTAMPRDKLVGLFSERVRLLPVLDADGVVQDLLLANPRAMVPVATPSIGERELRYVMDAVLSGWVSSKGKYIELFEQAFASFCGTPHAVAVMNGTVALHIALTALGIGPGDEVIIPALTFVATASAVRHCGAKPVFVDIEAISWNIDPDRIEEVVTSHTKAIIAVHLYGQPCRIDRIKEIAERRGLWLIEDAAEAHGAKFNGRRVGSFGHMGTFSFFGNKIITTGEGGAVVLHDASLYRKLRILRDHGMSLERRYWHEVVGYNYRMTNLQAAIGVAQLERWNEIYCAKKRIKELYNKYICTPELITAEGWDQSSSVCWLYTLILNSSFSRIDRDDLLSALRDKQIDSRPVFHTLPAMPPYYEPDWKEHYPISYRVSSHGFNLPSAIELQEKDIKRVAMMLSSALAKVKKIPIYEKQERVFDDRTEEMFQMRASGDI